MYDFYVVSFIVSFNWPAKADLIKSRADSMDNTSACQLSLNHQSELFTKTSKRNTKKSEIPP